MIRFFSSLIQLHQFTLNLSFHSKDVQCSKCLQFNQFTSHGFFYKQKLHGEKLTSGKRIFCSNRNGRSGCGASFRLYHADCVPNCTVSAAVLSCFILALLLGNSIQQAYYKATGCEDPRHAYRWIHRIHLAQINYRQFLPKLFPKQILPKQRIDWFSNKTKSPRLYTLLDPISDYFSLHKQNTCSNFQANFQCAFL